MKVKTSELQGAALDGAVAKCEGRTTTIWKGYVVDEFSNPLMYHDDPALAYPIIKREKIGVWWATHFVDGEGVEYGNHWYAERSMTDEDAEPSTPMVGKDPLEAAMRCYVASKLGEEVDVPDELTELGE